jgi:hypothetical protein
MWRTISAAEAFRLASEDQRRRWFGADMQLKEFEGAYSGPSPLPSASGPPADPGQVLGTRAALDQTEGEIRWIRDVGQLRRLLAYEQAGLAAWALDHPVDLTAPLPQSQAARRHQEAADAALIASWQH